MDVRDGFIVGISSYCDRWCERCPFTPECRLFADCAQIDASLDPGLREIAVAPPLPADAQLPPPDWLGEVIEDYQHAVLAAVPMVTTTQLASRLPPAYAEIEARARAYAMGVARWLKGMDRGGEERLGTLAVITRFLTLIPAKIYRALAWHSRPGPLDPADRDHLGSTKVALLGIDESHAAFLLLVEGGRASHADVAVFIADLVWLGETLERVFPAARAFVRPGFDEPEEVARLRASGDQ